MPLRLKLWLRSAALAALSLLAGCAVSPQPVAAFAPAVTVSVLPIDAVQNRIRLRFEEDTPYPCVVTEIQAEGGVVLVECWRTGLVSGRTDVDYHKGMDVGDVRYCMSYPAEVADVSWSDGFGHLGQNRDGSVVSDIPSGWNSHYQALHPIWRSGRVVTDDRAHAVHWQIERTVDGYVVTVLQPYAK